MDFQSLSPITACLASAGLTAGTTTTYTTARAISYALGGKAYYKAAVTNGATPTTDATTGAAFVALTAGYGSAFVFGFDKDGTIKVSQGSVEALDVSGNFINLPKLPALPDTVCPFGYLVAKGGSTLSGSWTFGSSNLSGVTGMTYAFADIATYPARPQAS